MGDLVDNRPPDATGVASNMDGDAEMSERPDIAETLYKIASGQLMLRVSREAARTVPASLLQRAAEEIASLGAKAAGPTPPVPKDNFIDGWRAGIEAATHRLADSWTWDDEDFLSCVIADLKRLEPTDADMGAQPMTRPTKANFASKLADVARLMMRYTADDLDDCLTWAEDELSDAGETKTAMLVDGMRTGIQQAREADAGARVVTIWFDDNGARATFSWNPGDGAGEELRAALMQAVESALKTDGE